MLHDLVHYFQLTCSSGYVLTSSTPFLWPVEQFSRDLSPALLRACKQIHEEAGSLLYRNNAFTFSHPSDLTVFRHIMDKRFTVLMSQVTFYIKPRTFERIWRSYIVHKRPQRSLYNDLPLLKTLTVVLEGSWWHNRWHPETNLKEWFNHDVTFSGLCATLDTVAVDRAGTEVKIICRQRIPRPHFRVLTQIHDGVLQSLDADSATSMRRWLVARSGEQCIRVSTNGKFKRDCVLDLWVPAAESAEG